MTLRAADGGARPRRDRPSDRVPGRTRRTRWATAATVAAAALVVTGCADGQRAQTAYETPVLDGTGTQVGSLDIRAAKALAPAGDSYAAGADLPLSLYIVNTGTSADELTGITSTIAGGSTLLPAGSTAAGAATASGQLPSSEVPTSSLPDVQGSSAPDATTSGGVGQSGHPAPSTAGTGPATGSGSTSPSASAVLGSAAPGQLPTLTIPAGSAVSLGTGADAPVAELTGLKQALYPSQSFTLTLTFAHAGTVSFAVAVQLPVSTDTSTPTADTSPTAQN